ncbi:membrane protein insertase YidC [Pseudonocardia halophobica]|uniref:Membrane protein insertase YidC n=1 Tax=Pseudonocardia halophobica TaxID=29401 RepID=A0A9W6LAL4_9PSEU|nr:membrane protein insertase YidC [Pseudonocardia halophobica]GLL14854.1 membrane protein insertase YidC [Pseudonocardia halophobica]
MLDFLYYPVSAVMWFWHQAFGLVLGPSSGVAWALSVVFLVLTLRALMIRPVLSQMRSAQRMRRIAPQLAELRTRHGRDKQKLAEETMKLHREHGVSPLGSFLPVLVQIPVFVALLHVLRYFNRPGLTFDQNAAIANYVFGPDEVRSFLEARLFGAPLSAYVSMPQGLLDSFGAPVDRISVVAVAVPLMLLAAVATHVTARRSLRQQQPATDPQTAQITGVMRLTPWLFPLGAIVGGLFFPFPIAILVYWLTSNAWTLGQQHVIGRIVEREQPPAPVRAPVRTPAVAPRPGQKPIRRTGATAARARRGA